MATPFGGHPTLGKYLAWASNEGCQVQSGLLGTVSATKITSPSGQHSVPIIGMSQDEVLSPTFVSFLDRRLKLSSPFPKAQLGYDE